MISPPPWDVPDIPTMRRIRWQLMHMDWTIQGPLTVTGDGRWVALRRASDDKLPELVAGDTLAELMDELEARNDAEIDDLGGDAA